MCCTSISLDQRKSCIVRRLWTTRTHAVARREGTTYGELVACLKAANIEVDGKILAELAVSEPKAFAAIVKTATK